MTILVCPLPGLPGLVSAEQPSHVVTLASPGAGVPDLPPGPARLHLAFNDISGPRPGLRPPSKDQVETLLAFGRSWNGRHPMAVGCELGVSRSPAAAFALACQAWPEIAPRTIARRLRLASAQATPNRLLVALADALLSRGGTMTAAVAEIGRGTEFVSAAGFRLSAPDPWRVRDRTSSMRGLVDRRPG